MKKKIRARKNSDSGFDSGAEARGKLHSFSKGVALGLE